MNYVTQKPLVKRRRPYGSALFRLAILGESGKFVIVQYVNFVRQFSKYSMNVTKS